MQLIRYVGSGRALRHQQGTWDIEAIAHHSRVTRLDRHEHSPDCAALAEVARPIAAAALWYLVIFGSYARVEKIFLLMTLVFFAYPIAAMCTWCCSRRRPAAEPGLDLRQDLGQRQVGDDEHLHIVGTEPAVVETDQVVPGKSGDRRSLAEIGGRIGVVLAIEQHRKGACGDRVRLLLRLRNRGQRLGLDPLQLGRIEVGTLDDIGQQVERRPEVGAERRQRDVRPVGAP